MDAKHRIPLSSLKGMLLHCLNVMAQKSDRKLRAKKQRYNYHYNELVGAPADSHRAKRYISVALF